MPDTLQHKESYADFAHRLAREMGVTLALVPVDRERMAEQLAMACRITCSARWSCLRPRFRRSAG